MDISRILILDFGSQYTHLIANRIRTLGVYSEIIIPNHNIDLTDKNIKGIILSGGPSSVYDANRPAHNEELLSKVAENKLNIPLMGICYGHQLLSHELGGKVEKGKVREYGKAEVSIKKDSPLTKGLAQKEIMWMSHGDEVTKLPEGFEIVGSSSDCESAIIYNEEKNIYGLQFHPEVTHSYNGIKILENFVNMCVSEKNWSMEKYLELLKQEIKDFVKDKKVFLLVSGGVDSTVAFALLKNILGDDKVLGLHIDNGLMRLGETADIDVFMKEHGFSNLEIENATVKFLNALKEKYAPEEKRKIIGNMFLEIKDDVIEKLGINPDDYLLAQGTIYPDTIESGDTKNAQVIKTHHNRVDIIQELILAGKIIEPLKELYKDEVRELGELLGIPKPLVWRHPFPGPGLGVRVLCSETEEFEAVSQEAEIKAFVEENGYKCEILPTKSVGVQGDNRTYAHPVMLFGGERNWDKLDELSTKLTNRFSDINRVVYNISKTEINSIKLKKCYITPDRLEVLRKIDDLNTKLIEKHNLYAKIWQMPVVLVPACIDTDEEVVVLRPVESQEAMTAQFYRIDWKVLDELIEKSEGVSSILYDITHKPPGTIEWE